MGRTQHGTSHAPSIPAVHAGDGDDSRHTRRRCGTGSSQSPASLTNTAASKESSQRRTYSLSSSVNSRTNTIPAPLRSCASVRSSGSPTARPPIEDLSTEGRAAHSRLGRTALWRASSWPGSGGTCRTRGDSRSTSSGVLARPVLDMERNRVDRTRRVGSSDRTPGPATGCNAGIRDVAAGRAHRSGRCGSPVQIRPSDSSKPRPSGGVSHFYEPRVLHLLYRRRGPTKWGNRQSQGSPRRMRRRGPAEWLSPTLRPTVRAATPRVGPH